MNILPRSIICSIAKKLKWFSVFFAFSPQLYAVADGPDFWQVRGVEKDDVLNIRLYADFTAPKTGAMPYDAQCIRNMGCIGGLTLHEFTILSEAEKQRITKQRPRWCRISYQGLTGWVAGRYLQEGSCPSMAVERVMPRETGVDPYNHSYHIENETVTLYDGVSRRTIEGSAAIIITEIANQPLYVDVNNDGIKDAVLVLMQQTGGSGTFYYLAVAFGDTANIVPVVTAYFLGDRVTVKSVYFVDDVIVVDYLDRAQGQPMADKPVLWKSEKLRLAGDKLVIRP